MVLLALAALAWRWMNINCPSYFIHIGQTHTGRMLLCQTVHPPCSAVIIARPYSSYSPISPSFPPEKEKTHNRISACAMLARENGEEEFKLFKQEKSEWRRLIEMKMEDGLPVPLTVHWSNWNSQSVCVWLSNANWQHSGQWPGTINMSITGHSINSNQLENNWTIQLVCSLDSNHSLVSLGIGFKMAVPMNGIGQTKVIQQKVCSFRVLLDYKSTTEQ